MSNEITFSQTHTHFSTPHETIELLMIETISKFDTHSHVIKFSYKPTPDSLVNWGLITSLSPLKCYGKDWMFKMHISQMTDIFDDKIMFNSCVDFVKNKTLEDLLYLLENSETL